MKINAIRKSAKQILDKYEQATPASYAAAQQAIGGLLVLDGFLGIDNPFGGRKRAGILGSAIALIIGVACLFIPNVLERISGADKMTATTSATVISVQRRDTSQDTNNDGINDTNSSVCQATAEYSVNGRQYRQQSAFESGSSCNLAAGQQANINYDPSQPSSWGYDVAALQSITRLIPIFGAVIGLVGLVTFTIRLLSIVLGWKLLRRGRALAATLPQGTDLTTIMNEVKQEFNRTVFSTDATGPSPTNSLVSGLLGFPANQTVAGSAQPPAPAAPPAVPAPPPAPTVNSQPQPPNENQSQ